MPVSDRSRMVSNATQGAIGIPEPGANSVMGGGSLPALLDALRSGQLSAEHIMALMALLSQAQGGMTDIGQPGLPPGPAMPPGPPGGGGAPNPIAAAMMGGGGIR